MGEAQDNQLTDTNWESSVSKTGNYNILLQQYDLQYQIRHRQTEKKITRDSTKIREGHDASTRTRKETQIIFSTEIARGQDRQQEHVVQTSIILTIRPPTIFGCGIGTPRTGHVPKLFKGDTQSPSTPRLHSGKGPPSPVTPGVPSRWYILLRA